VAQFLIGNWVSLSTILIGVGAGLDRRVLSPSEAALPPVTKSTAIRPHGVCCGKYH